MDATIASHHVRPTHPLLLPSHHVLYCFFLPFTYKQLDSLLSKGLSKTTVDRPIGVEGCSAESTLQAPHNDTPHGGLGRREKTPPVVAANRSQKPSRLQQHPGRKRKAAIGEIRPGMKHDWGEECGGVTTRSLAELSPPFFGDRGAAESSPPSCSGQNARGFRLDRKENANANANANADTNAMAISRRKCPEALPRCNTPTSPQRRNAYLPTVSLVW